MEYEPTIGIETHVQLKSNSKMFCGSKNSDEIDAPNTNICPICMGHPGTLPVLNEQAVKLASRAALALEAEVQPACKFDRKHYFYPDLPKGYQISQYDQPLARGGRVVLGGTQEIRLERIQMEEDTAKLLHKEGGSTLIDFNRAGTPLLEIVSQPDMHSAQEAKAYAQELRLILIYAGVSEGNLKKGQMRFDVNVSIKEKKEKKLGKRAEIKNINSFQNLEKAVAFEIRRQTKLRQEGGLIQQETRGWDDVVQETVSQRGKEEAQDYRYFPEPDIPPLTFSEEFIKEIAAQLPELPQQRRTRFMEEYDIPPKDVVMFIENRELSDFFVYSMSELQVWLDSLDTTEGSDEEIWQANRKKLTKMVLGWIKTEILRLMNAHDRGFQQLKITPENFAEFIILLYENKINSSAGQMILEKMFATGIDPSQAMQEMNLEQVSDQNALEEAVNEVLTGEQKSIEDYRKGKKQVLMFLVGKVMKYMKGKANPQMVTDILRKKLER